MPGIHPPIFWLGDVNGNIPPIFYVLSDIADQYWLPSVRSASSRFHSAIRRYLPSHTPPHSVVRPPNLELALTPLSITTDRRILTEGRIAGGAPEQNVPSPWGGSAPHLPWLVTWAQPESTPRHLGGLSHFVRLTVVTNRQTDRPRHIGNNRPHLYTLCMHAMRPNKNALSCCDVAYKNCFTHQT